MKIIIVGGGTAGWIAAYFIKKSQPQHDLTVIESSTIGIIGTGEGSTGLLVDLLSGFWFDQKIDIQDFMEKTDSTVKMGIRHENWSKIGDSYFAPLDASPTGYKLNDYIFKYVYHKFGKEKIHLASEIGINYENKKFDTPYALHFNGHKVGQYFKKMCMDDGVRLIDSVLKETILNEKGSVDAVILENDQQIFGDFFVDCTGFNRLLMKKLDVGWKSYKDVLSVNTAMPFLVQYEKNEKIIPETKATALSSGWMWNIPLTTRRGCGYVFDSNYISREQAVNEVEKYLNRKIDPIKWIEFDSGHSELFWKNNVICFGLSSSFVEPLEATSIHNTIVQIAIFVLEFLSLTQDQTITTINQQIYNERIAFLNKLTIDFISLHYQGGRSDTDFWKDIKLKNRITDSAKKIMDTASCRIPGYVDLEGMYGSFSVPLVNWLLAGMDVIDQNISSKELDKFCRYDSIEKEYNNFYQSVTNKKSYILYK